MHYTDARGRHCEIDLTPRGEFILGGKEPHVLSPVAVAKEYVPADERRRAERRHHGLHSSTGRRHRDHTSAAQDAEMALTLKKLRDSGPWLRPEAA